MVQLCLAREIGQRNSPPGRALQNEFGRSHEPSSMCFIDFCHLEVRAEFQCSVVGAPELWDRQGKVAGHLGSVQGPDIMLEPLTGVAFSYGLLCVGARVLAPGSKGRRGAGHIQHLIVGLLVSPHAFSRRLSRVSRYQRASSSWAKVPFIISNYRVAQQESNSPNKRPPKAGLPQSRRR